MRRLVEIIAAGLLVACMAPAASAADPMGRTADGLGCRFSLPPNASPTARCAAIRRQCGGTFAANYCGDRMLSAGH